MDIVPLQASKALKLCCRASWTCVKRLCMIFVQKPKGLDGDLSEDAIIEFVNEACTRSAFLLDVLHQCDSHKVKRTIAEILEDWSVPGKVFEMLPGPVPLVKQWVKVSSESFQMLSLLFFLLPLPHYYLLFRWNVNVVQAWLRRIVFQPCTVCCHLLCNCQRGQLA